MAKASILHLNQQVQPLLKWIHWRTKDPANRIKALIRVNIADITLQVFQYILNYPFLPPTSAWNLKFGRTFMLHLDQQVQSFLKLIRRRTKAPPKNIYALTSVDLTDATLHETLQYCKESPKAPFLSRMSAWLLHLARASTLYLDQQIQPFLKWLKGQTKVFTNGIDTLTGSDLWDATLQYYQELLKYPLLSPISAWHLQLETASIMYMNKQVHLILQWLQ